MPLMPDPWAWDEFDMLITEQAEATEAARRAEVIHDQIEHLAPFDDPAWRPEDSHYVKDFA